MWVTLGIVLLTYVGLALGHLPGYRMNRAGIALVGASFLVLVGRLDLEAAWQALDAPTLIFLFGVMVLNAQLSYAGFFDWLMGWVGRYVRSPLGLLVILTFGSGLLSALFLNDTMALVLAPLVVRYVRILGGGMLSPTPYLLALMGAVNIGSLLTPTGNPQNILIASLSGLSYTVFLKWMWPVVLGGLVVQVGLIYWLYPAIRSVVPLPFGGEGWSARRIHRPLLWKGVLVASALLGAFLGGYPMAEAAFIASGLLLFSRRLRSSRFFRLVDWELLVLFGGLFVVTAAARQIGLVDRFLPLLKTSFGFMGVGVLLSLLISNVPAVLLLTAHVQTERDWLLLAGASTLAGNLTLLASVANLIIVESARKQGLSISFWTHFRFGLLLTLISLGLLYWRLA